MLRQILKNAVDAHKERQNIRQSINELHALTDRELNDMGISRCDIPRVVMKGTKHGEKFNGKTASFS